MATNKTDSTVVLLTSNTQFPIFHLYQYSSNWWAVNCRRKKMDFRNTILVKLRHICQHFQQKRRPAQTKIFSNENENEYSVELYQSLPYEIIHQMLWSDHRSKSEGSNCHFAMFSMKILSYNGIIASRHWEFRNQKGILNTACSDVSRSVIFCNFWQFEACKCMFILYVTRMAIFMFFSHDIIEF